MTTLYYVGDYSHREISEFLGVPISTIKNRLHSARKRLMPELVETVEDSLHAVRPSSDAKFSESVRLVSVADTEGNGFALISYRDMTSLRRRA